MEFLFPRGGILGFVIRLHKKAIFVGCVLCIPEIDRKRIIMYNIIHILIGEDTLSSKSNGGDDLSDRMGHL